MKTKMILFDLDGTLLPMDQDVFVKYYFGLLAKRLAPLGYESEKLIQSIWGGTGADGYLGMTEDPYDLENPSSLENTLTISRTCEGSAKLRAMLDEALAEAMRSQGLMEGMWRFVSIEKIEPAMPRYEGSLMCDELAFTLNVEVTRPAPEAMRALGTLGR